MPAYLPSLTDRAKLAIGCLTELCDPARGNVPYFYTRLSDRPPTAGLSIWSYGDGLGRSVDALALLRHMTGDHIDHPQDRAMRATLMCLMGVDGLSWCPAEPWTMSTPHTRPAWLQQGTLLALTTLWQLTGDGEYRRLAEANIAAVAKMSVHHREGYADFPGDSYTRRDGWSAPPSDPMHRFSVFSTSITMPLMRYYRLTGHEPALRLAADLIAWALRDHDGGAKLFDVGHFHCQSRVVTALLLRGAVTGNKEDLELGERLYRKARSLGTESGWFPEQINNPEHNRSNLSETCCLTDMLESAILLAQVVDPGYWHDVERYARNHLLVHQIVDTDWFGQLTYVPAEQHVLGHRAGDGQGGAVQAASVAQRLVGGFAGWGGVTAMSDDSMFSNSNQHCCNAAGARALYDAWRHSVDDSEGVFTVNLHLRRTHAAAEVTVEDGDTALLRIAMKQARRVHVRVPENVGAFEMQAARGGAEVRPVELKGFLDLGSVAAGDVVEVRYPQKPRTTLERIAPGAFTFEWRGATVVSASPIQKVRPLFTPARFAPSPPPAGPVVEREIQAI